MNLYRKNNQEFLHGSWSRRIKKMQRLMGVEIIKVGVIKELHQKGSSQMKLGPELTSGSRWSCVMFVSESAKDVKSEENAKRVRKVNN